MLTAEKTVWPYEFTIRYNTIEEFSVNLHVTITFMYVHICGLNKVTFFGFINIANICFCIFSSSW